MTSRPDRDTYFLGMAILASSRATCCRRRVGCVLVDKHGHVLATGYNGVPRGQQHCTDVPCPGAGLPSGTGLTACEAIHAEQNALIQCKDSESIDTVYCTASPCLTCMRMLVNTSAKRIVFGEVYPHNESELIARRAGMEWVHVNTRTD